MTTTHNEEVFFYIYKPEAMALAVCLALTLTHL